MFAPFVLLALSGNSRVDSTPEWKQYQAVLAKHKVIVASVYLRQFGQEPSDPYRAGFEATIWPDGSYVASAWPQSFVWSSSAKRGLKLRHGDKTYRFVSSENDAPSLLSMLGIVKSGERIGEREITSMITRVSPPSLPQRRESGFEASAYHVDAGWRSTWMFDSKTHLMTQFTCDTLGPMAAESHIETQAIQWRFDTGEKFSLAPPKGYRETKDRK